MLINTINVLSNLLSVLITLNMIFLFFIDRITILIISTKIIVLISIYSLTCEFRKAKPIIMFIDKLNIKARIKYSDKLTFGFFNSSIISPGIKVICKIEIVPSVNSITRL